MKHTQLFGTMALVGSLGLAGATQAQTTIYADDFSGGGGALNGTTPDTTPAGEMWQAGAVFLDNGQVDSFESGGPDGQAAFLPLTTEAGVYTASATLTNLGPDWIAFGFMPTLPPGGDWTVQDFSVRHSNSGAYAWVLGRTNPNAENDTEGFAGVNTAGLAFTGDLADVSAGLDIDIVLDTRSMIWTAEYLLNGASQGVFDLPATANAEVGGIGFSRERDGSLQLVGGQVSDFSLTLDAHVVGDTDDDGDIDDFDLLSAISSFTGSLGAGVGTANYADGDTDADGDVDDFDLLTMISGFTGSLSAPAVPEPGSVALLALGGLALLRRRRNA